MMTFSVTVLFYLTVGVMVGAAVLLRDDHSRMELCFRGLTAVCFWPIYLPILLQPVSKIDQDALQDKGPTSEHDDMSAAIRQVESELDAALGSLDGWSESLLADEYGRFAELKTAWRHQADRIRELDALLQQQNLADEARDRDLTAMRSLIDTPTRDDNLARLRDVRGRMYDELMGTLAWVRELVTMIHLARFTGAPASRAAELVAQIAAAVEGLSEVSHWEHENQPMEKQATLG